MEVILGDIATRRAPANALEPGKFVLKPEVFAAEYDSTFFHQSLQVCVCVCVKMCPMIFNPLVNRGFHDQ